ncbi:tyrosine-type recombinase/integrase [Pseudomonas urmiensis]
MELIWASDDFTLGGKAYAGFPLLLNAEMESFTPANMFLRHHILKGRVKSKKSWASVGRAMYDYFSFLEVNEFDWRDVDYGEKKTLPAAYRDYSLEECGLSNSTVRQRIYYICQFYVYALNQGWVKRLPFDIDERKPSRGYGFFAHINARRSNRSNDLLPRKDKRLPKFLSPSKVLSLLNSISNPHHYMMVKFALSTGLRREELATFPLCYIFDPDQKNQNKRNFVISIDPSDGSGIKTKGSKARDIYISRRLLAETTRYIQKQRNERSSLSKTLTRTLFVNHQGAPYANGGKGIERIIRSYGARIGIRLHPHMLRHTYATLTLRALQVSRSHIDPLIFLQRQLGHASIETTMVYLDLLDEDTENAILEYDDELILGLETV